MTRPDIAAALEGIATWRGTALFIRDEQADACLEAARLLRATNPPAGAERATEAVYTDDTPLMLEYREADEPATPAVGEDEALLRNLDLFGSDERHVWVFAATFKDAASRLRALLADVARLTADRDEADETMFAALAWKGELQATLAAVRKIADDYHDVDVTVDPPRKVACNPCAAEILNVLEGKP